MLKQGGTFFETDMSNFDAHVIDRLQCLFLELVSAFGFEGEQHCWDVAEGQVDSVDVSRYPREIGPPGALRKLLNS